MFLLCSLLAIISPEQRPDSITTYNIPSVVISAPIKHSGIFSGQPVAASSFSISDIERNHIAEPKDLSLSVPNFIQADYGSKMTSSIYMRGIGARMEQPSVGLYVDNVPILNKNNYDLDYYDLRQIYVLRGPQGTLYGRNTIGGVIDIHTLSPLDYKGTRIYAGYGNGNTSELKVSTYHNVTKDFGLSLAFNHKYSDGFFTNVFDDSSADRILSEGLRLKVAARLKSGWVVENTASVGLVKQKGFAYSLYDEKTGNVWPINHNDPCSYDRINFIDGLTFRRQAERYTFSSTTSYQFTDDKMTLDQDLRPVSMFTLEQKQVENAVTQEFVLRSNNKSKWQWITGAFGFYKHLAMDAPVLFKRDGINELILENANQGIQSIFPNASLEIEEDSFPIESNFRLPTWGMSLYHQSTFTTGRWSFTAGLRADFEHASIEYDNNATINYRFTLTMPGFKELPVSMDGGRSKSYFELMPKFSALYDHSLGNIYATITRGYKAGGYNTQIFSDILQNKMMTDLMDDLGIYFGDPNPGYEVSKAISYKPEYSWNYEIGTHLDVMDGRMQIDAALFYIDLRDQQLTVFPAGKTTGRLMSNAGRSRSFGAEFSGVYRLDRITLSGSYGYTNAKFTQYYTGDEDFYSNFVPYIPQHTVSLTAGYSLPVSKRTNNHIRFNIGWQGAGDIYWNDANTVSQDFYGLLNASILVHINKVSFGIWGKNITDNDFNTFYFKSVGNTFVQRGKPLQFGININLTI